MITFIERLEEAVISLLLVALTLLVFFEVVLRFGFGQGLIWVQEVSLYLGAWFILLGASYALRVGAHIAVEALVALLDGPIKRVVAATAIVLSLVYCGILIVASWSYLSRLVQLGIEMEDVAIPRWLGQSCILIGFVLLALRLLVILIAVLRGKSDGLGHVDEGAEALETLVGGDAPADQAHAGKA